MERYKKKFSEEKLTEDKKYSIILNEPDLNFLNALLFGSSFKHNEYAQNILSAIHKAEHK